MENIFIFWHAACININQTQTINLTQNINAKKGGCKNANVPGRKNETST